MNWGGGWRGRRRRGGEGEDKVERMITAGWNAGECLFLGI